MCNAGLGTLCSDLESFVPDEGVTMIGRARSGAIAVLCSCGHCSGILAKTAA